jgi:phage shock protein A
MHILEEWRFRDVEQKADRAHNRLYEIDTLNSNVGSLEHSMREVRALVDGLRNELEAAQGEIQQLKAELETLVAAKIGGYEDGTL